MNWVEFAIYGVCLVGSNYMTFQLAFKRGINDCLIHLEDEGIIKLEHDNDDEM